MTPRRDHPRSRGVYRAPLRPPARISGSSPLARGLLDAARLAEVGERIIPARAGFTPGSLIVREGATDHPRSRGVYWRHRGNRPSRPGSSPLARGLREVPAGTAGSGRIIPARAGFTWPSRNRTARMWDHPRSRGVYDTAWDEMMDGWGSSPLARGLPLIDGAAYAAVRIIPARAGFTWPSCGCWTGWPDHPRSRGVYVAERKEVQERRGSSPLARGLRRRPAVHRHYVRIIPARAGFTQWFDGTAA